MKKNIVDIIREILITEGLPIPIEINRSTRLRQDLGFDSLMLAVLTVLIENEYEIDIFENGSVSTVSDIYDKLNKK